jgi:hypothetical protein
VAFVPHNKLTWFGEFRDAAGVVVETWSNTTCWGSADGTAILPDGDIDPMLSAIYPILTSWFASSGNFFSNHNFLVGAKLARINTTGHDDGSTHAIYGSQAGGLVDANVVAPQNCVVASLETGQRGPRKRGRVYLAHQVIPTAADGWEMPATTATHIAEQFRDTMHAIRLSAIGVTTYLGELVVASSMGSNTVVTGIRVGQAIDTQRRRRRALAEKYHHVSGL